MDCRNLIKQFLFSFLSWLLLFLLLPITFPFTILVIGYKHFVNGIVSLLHPDWIPLTGLDITGLGKFDVNGGKYLSNVGLGIVVEEDLNLEEVQVEFRRRVLNVKVETKHNRTEFKFHRLMEHPVKFMGHFYFTGPREFVDLNQNIKESKTTKKLEEFVIDWISTGYYKDQPLWEMVLYKNNSEERIKEETILLFKMSHGVGDILSIKNIVEQLILPKDLTYEYQPSKPRNTFVETIKTLATAPYLLLHYVLTMFPSHDSVAEIPKVDAFCGKYFEVRLDSVKKIRKMYGCRFTDVLLTLSTSSLRRTLLETKRAEDVSKSIGFFSPRVTPSNRPAIFNSINQTLLLHIPISNPSIQERLIEIQKISKTAMHSRVQKLLYFFSQSAHYLPILFMERPDFPVNCISCGFSSIPEIGGSKLLFEKYPVSSIFLCAGIQMKQFGFMALSCTFGNKIVFSMIGNKGIFKNSDSLDRFGSYFVEEMEALLNGSIPLQIKDV